MFTLTEVMILVHTMILDHLINRAAIIELKQTSQDIYLYSSQLMTVLVSYHIYKCTLIESLNHKILWVNRQSLISSVPIDIPSVLH